MPVLLRIVTGVGLATVLYKSLAAIQQILVARVLGATPAADAFFLAQILPVLLGGLLCNSLSSSMVFVLGGGGRRVAWMRMLVRVLAGVSVLCGALWMAGPLALRILAPAASEELLAMSARLQNALLPVLLFQTCAGVMTGVLLSRERFFAAPLSMCLFYGGGMAGLLLTAGDGDPFGLAAGLASGAALQAGILLWLLRKDRVEAAGVVEDADWRALLRQALPALGCNAISTLFLVTDRSFAAGFGPGQMAAMSYVYSLVTMPTQIIVNTVVGVSMPGWVRTPQGSAEFAHAVTRALAMLSVALLPAAVCLALGASPVARMVLGTSRFSPEQIEAATNLLTAYAPAILGFAAKDALTAAALSRGKAGFAFGAGLAGVLLAVGMKAALAPVAGILAGAAGTFAGLALATLALVRMLAGREIPVLYWRYGKEAVLASLPALAIGLAAANWLGSPSWAAAALALAIYGGSWLGFGGVAASQQLLRGRRS